MGIVERTGCTTSEIDLILQEKVHPLIGLNPLFSEPELRGLRLFA